jgi:IclR family transcriptional regulator, KDG regulon repressor
VGALDQTALLSGDKLLVVVELLMRHAEALPARTIAQELGINRTTVHRALNTLMYRGWVERQPGATDYRLSVKFLALAHVSTQTRSFLQEVRPSLDDLSRLSRETVHVGVLDGFEILHVDKIDSLERLGIASKIGSRGPAHKASLGKALLAAGSDAVLEDYIAHATNPARPMRLADPDAFRTEMWLTRARGYSVDNEEDAVGVRCLGVAVRGAGGVPLFAISLTGPAARFTMERVEAHAPAMVATAHALSLQLGWEPGGDETGLVIESPQQPDGGHVAGSGVPATDD